MDLRILKTFNVHLTASRSLINKGEKEKGLSDIESENTTLSKTVLWGPGEILAQQSPIHLSGTGSELPNSHLLWCVSTALMRLWNWLFSSSLLVHLCTEPGHFALAVYKYNSTVPTIQICWTLDKILSKHLRDKPVLERLQAISLAAPENYSFGRKEAASSLGNMKAVTQCQLQLMLPQGL